IKKTRERLFDLQKVEHIAKRGLLSSTLSLLLAKRLSLTSFSSLHFALSEKKWVEAFIECQIELSTNNHFLQKEESQMERVQRILSLFPIARELPSELEEKELKRAIQIILSLLKGEDKGAHLSISSPLFVFINAQLHIISESKGGSDRKELEEKVIYAYKVASILPYLSPIACDHLEMLVWKRLEEKENLLRKVPEEEREVVDKEIGNILIENPHQTFQGMILTALQLFKKIAQFDLKKKEKELERKSELWAVQGEMLCKSIHFDEKNPLLLLIQKEWETWSSNRAFFHHREFIHYILECAMKKYTILEAYPKEFKIRIWILYKYFWYQLLKKPEESTYERFLSYHTHNLKTKHPSWKKEEIERALEEISKATLPLIPTPAHAMCNFK
ncbi:MAG: hypothetical protein HYZ47_05555, partial [Simkania negevensis]|nr:hypothetical protein [Simkania negevensis]